MTDIVAIFILLVFTLTEISTAEGIRFYGDLLLSRGISNLVADQGEIAVQKAFQPFFKQNAIHIVNLEGAVGDTSHCSKGHTPCFAINPRVLNLLNGFQVVSLENNHSIDLGPKGLTDAAIELKKQKIIPLAGNNFTSVVNTENGNIGIVSVTDVVNSADDIQYVTMADSPKVLKEIRNLKYSATAVAVYIHWGRELFPIATERMKRLAKKYIEAGADIIVGTHPHVVGPIEYIQGRPVIYSTGNFLFDQKYADTKKGIVFDCDIGEDGILRCTITGHETAMNSYLPYVSTKNQYLSENKILSACSITVERTWTGIFTADLREKKIVLKKDTSNNSLWYMEIYDLNTKKRDQRTPSMPIRKLQCIDLDEDGIQEILLLQDIYSAFDKEIAKRVYIYSMNNGFHALWRGTSLSRPLLDASFILSEKDKPILVALHSADSFLLRNPDCRKRIIMTYKWNGFGFDGVKELLEDNYCNRISYTNGIVRLVEKGKVIKEIPGRMLE